MNHEPRLRRDMGNRVCGPQHEGQQTQQHDGALDAHDMPLLPTWSVIWWPPASWATRLAGRAPAMLMKKFVADPFFGKYELADPRIHPNGRPPLGLGHALPRSGWWSPALVQDRSGR